MTGNLFIKYYQQLFTKSSGEPPTPEEIIEQGHLICKDFVVHKLKRSNLIKSQTLQSSKEKKQSLRHVLTLHGVNAISNLMLGSNTSDKNAEIVRKALKSLEDIGSQLEVMYPDLYKGISCQLGINISCEPEMVAKAYKTFATYMLNGNNECQFYWGKVVSILCVTAGLSVECARLGRWDIITKIIECFDKVVAQFLLGWLLDQNGWITPPDLMPNRNSKVKKYFLIFGTFLAIFFSVLFVAYNAY